MKGNFLQHAQKKPPMMRRLLCSIRSGTIQLFDSALPDYPVEIFVGRLDFVAAFGPASGDVAVVVDPG